ncbi:unnamed protein product [Meloidogyne enterolobii]|uniref:Uncharacterized protein n=1 Tax=Meloidogyne enterolobii TaxID=390850 RepID=A0ACB0ZI52_MELEN
MSKSGGKSLTYLFQSKKRSRNVALIRNLIGTHKGTDAHCQTLSKPVHFRLQVNRGNPFVHCAKEPIYQANARNITTFRPRRIVCWNKTVA